jgi:iron(III) transport system substrate-binding protein
MRSTSLITGLILGLFGLAAPSYADLVIYNAQHESLTKAWVDQFTKETGIKVTMRHGKDSELANQIIQEGGKSPADVFLTENSPAMSLVEKAGLLATINPKTLNQVPATYKPSSGQWVGIAARATVFAYNPNRLTAKELPTSLLDLAKPSWQGRWGASPSGADFQAIVSAVLNQKGEKETLTWLQGMKKNAVAYQGNGTVMKAVNAGQIDGGVIYHYYYFGDQAKTGENSKNVKLHYFGQQDPGAFVSLSGGGVLASSKQQEEAQRFLAWLTGVGGQTILKTGDAYEYAVGTNMPSHPQLRPLSSLNAPSIDPSKLDARKVSELMMSAGLL